MSACSSHFKARLFGVALMFLCRLATGQDSPASAQSGSALHCDTGISRHALRRASAHVRRGGSLARAAASTSAGAPPGMVWIPGGRFWMGSEHIPEARPVHQVEVSGFWMDQTDVTNQEFARFVKATGYKTVAERPLDPKEFPDVSSTELVPGSVVFSPPSSPVSLDDPLLWWRFVKGANWHHPEGPNANIRGREKYPVVQIAWPDAVAYAKWAGKRLPTEAEWEFAARGGLDRKQYVWGNEFKPGDKWRANTYQGHFPDKNSATDGYVGVAPVASFPPNGYGLYDMAGNVWQWVSDWYREDYYAGLSHGGTVNPQGPPDSLDPQEPDVPKRVQKGGSFLCTDQYCERYTPGSRGKGDPLTATNHIGFRCVRSP